MIRWVFLDIDDTICNSSAAYAKALTSCWRVIRRTYPKLPKQEFYRAYEIARQRVHRRLRGTAAMHDRALYFEEVLRLLKLPFSAPLLSRLSQTYWSESLRHLKLATQAKQTLLHLRRAGVRIGVVSDLLEAVQVKKLKHLGVSRYVDFLVTSEAVGNEKPSPAIFRAALKRARCKPQEAVMVGDSPARDVVGAKRLGLKAILVGAGNRGKADARVASFQRLTPALLNRL